MSRIAEAKVRLPLPELMSHCGLADRAKKSARCPFHDDHHNSFSVWQNGDGCWAWKCHAGCGAGDEINFLESNDALSRKDAVRRFIEMAGVNGATPSSASNFNWEKCVAAFNDKHVDQVANWRGYSPEFVRELRESCQIGIYNGLVAFPVCENGNIVGTHYRMKDASWRYFPCGIRTAPLIFGELASGERVQIFESTWDGLDYMDKSGERDGIIITRGAENVKLVADVIPANSTVFCWTQNDQAGSRWEKGILANTGCTVKRVAIPAPYKDLNSWTRDGASADDLLSAMMRAELLRDLSSSVDERGVEVPPAPAPYRPPPLALLPSEFREYIHAAAESLNVDVSYILLPTLSGLGSAIGNARSILLKSGFIQPPIIWTGIIARSGARKSPALDAACSAVVERERELVQQNQDAMTDYLEAFATWDRTKKADRGARPAPPPSLTCLMDDLTLAALADALEDNPCGVLVKKDELSHWFAAMDQYHDAKGADVSRWLSLHTGVFFGFDRKTDRRHFRLWQPRVCIAGGIQPAVLSRVLTQDFFERGLPARFLFAAPPVRKDRWTDDVIPDRLRGRVNNIFVLLYDLEPEQQDRDCQPRLLRLTGEAREEFIAYYNACGAAAADGDEREEAAWSKLSGYAARLALVGQLARDPVAETVTGNTMQAACDLAQWCGTETTRIYASLSETAEQTERRRLTEFIQQRGGAVTVRDVMQSYRPLRNQKEKIEQGLDQLAKAGLGHWEEIRPAGRGRPTRKFHLARASTSTKIPLLRGRAENCVDVDASNNGGNTVDTECHHDPLDDPLISDAVRIFNAKAVEM